MTDRNERVRAAFFDEPDTTDWNRDGVLSDLMEHTNAVRRRRMYRSAGVVVALAAIIALAWIQLRLTPSRVPVPSRVEQVLGTPRTLDSIPTNPAEAAVTHQDRPGSATTITVHETPTSLIPLLGHRSQLSMELQNLNTKREEFSAALNANPGRDRANDLRGIISGIDGDIAATRNALRLVDQQLASMQGAEAPPVIAEGAITYAESPPIVIRPPLPGEPFLWAAGISTTALLIVFVALAYFRRTMRSAIDALASLQNQASTQMSALTSGIEAIAIEVERLGENQRFMSKVIAGGAKEGIESRGTS